MKLKLKTMFALCLTAVTLACFAAASRSFEDESEEPVAAEVAAQSMELADGFQATVFAAEPAVRQPISMCIDDRGRVWVAEAYSYPVHSEQAQRDRIVVFEDVDGDGRHDKRTVFYDKLNYVTGLEVGFGGVWVMSPPYFYFIPDADGDDRPDREPRVVLDGFGNFANAHNLANGFAWGPDGWLYGTHGRTNWSMIGKPGADKKDRKRFDGGVYRYHPVRDVWEPYVDGCTNPWGIDWDDYGQAFIPNTVNPHLFHAIPGAHFEPWRNRESSRFAYQRISTIADHLHFAGGGDVRAGIGSEEESSLGGGHSHCGILVYLGDAWPEEYRNTVLTHNTHGRRINRDILQRANSGYVATHGPDFLQSRDPWFMGVSLRCGPDGSVYSIDWSDTGECHSVRNTRRHTGRIYKVSYRDDSANASAVQRVDVAKASTEQLVRWQLHRNDWYVRHARRVLQERHARGADLSKARSSLIEILETHVDVTRRLRALWALHAIGAANESLLAAALSDSSEYVRAWAINLLCEEGTPNTQFLTRFAEMAGPDETPLVRLHLSSALQRIEAAQRWEIAAALLTHQGDRDDQNLPLMHWYAIEPLVHLDVERFARLAIECRLPLVQNHIGRRIASLADASEGLGAVSRVLLEANDEVREHLLDGVLVGLRGRRGLAAPEGWAKAVASLRDRPRLYEKTLAISLAFNDAKAIEELRKLAADLTADREVRARAVSQLVAARPPRLDLWLIERLDDATIRSSVLQGLASFNQVRTADEILARYSDFNIEERRQALQTLASRKAWAERLLDAVASKRVGRGDLTAYTIRQIASLGDRGLRERVEADWGKLRSSTAEKRNQIKRLKRQLSSNLDPRDRSHGRAVFQKSCAACHKLFDAGGNRGPNLTGAQRNSLDYLLEHIVDPNSSVARDYQTRVIRLKDGRVLSGLLAAETETTLSLQTQNEDIILAKVDVESIRNSDASLMPEKLLDSLSKRELRNLMAYLQGETQTPLPVENGSGGDASQ